MDASIDARLLSVYLVDHTAGATAGLHRVRRMASTYRETPLGEPLATMARQLEQERRWLMGTARGLGVEGGTVKRLAAAVGERLGRLKLNGRLVRRSPVTPLLELELLRSAVVGKLSGWQTLEATAATTGLTAEQVDRLRALQREADEQVELLSSLLDQVRPRAFRA